MDYYLAVDFGTFGELKPFIRILKLTVDSIIFITESDSLKEKHLIVDSHAFPDNVGEKYDNINYSLVPHLFSTFMIPTEEIERVECFIREAYKEIKTEHRHIFLVSEVALAKRNNSIRIKMLEVYVNGRL